LSPASFAAAFATALQMADAKAPQFRTYRCGIGPHAEDDQVRLALAELAEGPLLFTTFIPYPTAPRQKCDFAVHDIDGSAFIEAKLFRPAGDNGKVNDANLNHLLSPYEADRSALTDCRKLRRSGFDGRRFVLVIAYDWPARPFGPARAAFERLARADGPMSEGFEAPFTGLMHPHHSHGSVVVWEVL